MPDPDSKGIYSFRHTLEYKVAQTRDLVVWVDYIEGQYEVYAQDLPTGPRRQLMINSGDEGHQLELVQLSRSGQLLVVRSGHGFQERPFFGTAHRLLFPDCRLLLLDTAKGRVLQSIKGAGAAVLTPDETSLVWGRRGTVLACTPGFRRVRKQFTVRGRVLSLHWSPDGHRLAFVCQRRTRTLIGIYTPGRGLIDWVAPDFDRDDYPCWSPDSSRLAFIRFHGPEMDIADHLFSHQADSFSVMVTQVATGETRTLWPGDRESSAGFSRQYGHRPLLWIDSKHLLFSHDNCGWDHLYQLRLPDGQCTALTQGSWLVQDYCSSQDGSLVVLSHNRIGRHHYSLDKLTLCDGVYHPLAISQEQQYWQPSLSASNRYLLFLSGSHHHPCHLGYVDQHTGVLKRLTTPDAYVQRQAHRFVKPVTRAIHSCDRHLFHANLFFPAGEKNCPALVSIHGNDGRQTLPCFHQELEMSLRYALCQLLAQHGFLVMDINCRGQSGYGKLFRQAPERGCAGASDYLDVQAAGHWLRHQTRTHSQKIGVIGKSWGGCLSSLALARDSDLFRAGVVISGCANFPRELGRNHWKSCLFSSRSGERLAENVLRAKLAEQSSSWNWLDSWMSPVLLVHGDNDHYISFAESQQLAHQLIQRAVNVESLVLPDEGHNVLRHESQLQIADRVVDFLVRHLCQGL